MAAISATAMAMASTTRPTRPAEMLIRLRRPRLAPRQRARAVAQLAELLELPFDGVRVVNPDRHSAREVRCVARAPRAASSGHTATALNGSNCIQRNTVPISAQHIAGTTTSQPLQLTCELLQWSSRRLDPSNWPAEHPGVAVDEAVCLVEVTRPSANSWWPRRGLHAEQHRHRRRRIRRPRGSCTLGVADRWAGHAIANLGAWRGTTVRAGMRCWSMRTASGAIPGERPSTTRSGISAHNPG